jgi:hypothetical protein
VPAAKNLVRVGEEEPAEARAKGAFCELMLPNRVSLSQTHAQEVSTTSSQTTNLLSVGVFVEAATVLVERVAPSYLERQEAEPPKGGSFHLTRYKIQRRKNGRQAAASTDYKVQPSAK